MIRAYGAEWKVWVTGAQYTLPQVAIAAHAGPFSAQDYFTPDEARALARELTMIADEADAIESVRNALETAEANYFEHEDM